MENINNENSQEGGVFRAVGAKIHPANNDFKQEPAIPSTNANLNAALDYTIPSTTNAAFNSTAPSTANVNSNAALDSTIPFTNANLNAALDSTIPSKTNTDLKTTNLNFSSFIPSFFKSSTSTQPAPQTSTQPPPPPQTSTRSQAQTSNLSLPSLTNLNQSPICKDKKLIINCVYAIWLGKKIDSNGRKTDIRKPDLVDLCVKLDINVNEACELLKDKGSSPETLRKNEEKKNDVLQTYKKNNNSSFQTFMIKFKIEDLKTLITIKMNECNSYKYFTREIFLDIYNLIPLNPSSGLDDRNANDVLKSFFENEAFFNTVTSKAMSEASGNSNKIQKTVNEIQKLQYSEVVLTLRNFILNDEFFFSNILTLINNNLNLINNNIQPINFITNSRNKKFYTILIIYMQYIAANTNIQVNVNLNALKNLTPFNLVDMNNTFETEIPASLDARQFITVNKFTKYRQQNDKACFLFHGVGTGKTITSTTIALSHLSNENKFSKNGQGNESKKSLKVLAICPQGLFFSSFGDDAVILGMYVCNKTVYNVDGEEYTDANGNKHKYKYTFESFEACIKCNNDEASYYKVSFIGFNYLELFKYKGLEQLREHYDVLICDEAHKIITEKLQPESKQGYDINYKQGALDGQFGEMILEPQILSENADEQTKKEYNAKLQKYPTVTAIKDVRFVNFIKINIIKQSIFLTGTPIQKTPYDVVSIVKFLNIREINESNNKKLCKDVVKEAPHNSNYYYNRFNKINESTKNSITKGFLADIYLINQNLTGATVPDLEAELNKDNKEFNFIDFVGLFVGKEKAEEIYKTAEMVKQEGKKIYNQVNDIYKNVNDLQNLVDGFISDQTNYVNTKSKDALDALQKSKNMVNSKIKELKNRLSVVTDEKIKEVTDPVITKISNSQQLFDNLINVFETAKESQIPTEIDKLTTASNNLKDTLDNLKTQPVIIEIRQPGLKGGKNNSEIIKYVKDLPEQSLALKQEINSIIQNFDNSTLINAKPILNAIVKDTGISNDNIITILQFLFDCLNGKVPYEVSLKILGNEKVSTLLSPILGPNWVFLKNPVSFDISIENTKISFGGKKRVKTIKKKYLKRNKTHKKKYLGGEGELIPYSNANEQLLIQNINNDIFVKEIPILLELYLYNVGLTLQTQCNYFMKKTTDIILLKNTTNLLSDIQTLKYTEQLLTNYYLIEILNYDFEDTFYIEEINEEQTAGGPPTIKQLIGSFIKTIISNIVKLFQQGDGSPIDIKAISFMIMSRVLPFIVILIVSYMPSIPLPEWFKTPEFINRLMEILSSYTPEAVEKAIEFVSTTIAAAMSPIGKAATTPIGKSILTFFSQEIINFALFVGKICLSVINFAIENLICGGEFNLNGIIENLSPFISIYNYDYINTAIDNTEFYTQIVNSEPKYKLEQNVNKNGTTNAFPEKYIENIYYPFTQNQVKIIKDYEKGILNKLFRLGIIDMTNEKNSKLLTELNNILNKISCGIDINKNYEKTYLKNEYLKYFKTPKENETNTPELGFLENKAKIYTDNGSYNNRWQTGGVYISIDKITTKEYDLNKNFKDKPRLPINISENYVDVFNNTKPLWREETEFKEKFNDEYPDEFNVDSRFWGRSYKEEESNNNDNNNDNNDDNNWTNVSIFSNWQKKVTKIDLNDNKYFNFLRKKIIETANGISENVQFLQNKPYDLQLYKNEQCKFENVLELLKIIRTGVIFQGENTEIQKENKYTTKYTQFTYHPHYALNGIKTDSTTSNIITDDNTTVEYYLPIVYPPTDDIMFGFCDFLNKKGYKYIWLNKYLDPFDLKEQVNFGVRFTFPIKKFNDPAGNEPICIVISENHKEGFSFIYNPALISLGLSETAGDEEQIYGRVLRKYGTDALDGKYEKKIYQYFSGGNKDTKTLPILTSLYSLNNKTVFRGMYDNSGFSKTTANGSILGAVGDNIWLSMYLSVDSMTQFNTWISKETQIDIARQNTIANDRYGQVESEYLNEYFPILDLTDELQLKLLYRVKSVCLEFFKNIAKKENAAVTITFGQRINPYYWFASSPEPNFYPIDVQDMLKTNVSNPKLYCIENLNNPNEEDFELYIKNKNGNTVLNIKSALVCSNKGIVSNPTGGKRKKTKTKSKRYPRKTANKSIKKYKNKYNK